MLATEPHGEPGNHWVVVVPNEEFLGKRLGVGFIDGVGRTSDPDKAREFDLIYGYEVIPFPDAPTWKGAAEHLPEMKEPWGPEASVAAEVDNRQYRQKRAS